MRQLLNIKVYIFRNITGKIFREIHLGHIERHFPKKLVTHKHFPTEKADYYQRWML